MGEFSLNELFQLVDCQMKYDASNIFVPAGTSLLEVYVH